MKLRKLFAALLCLVYVYTNQLGIHAFAMHGEAIQGDANVITQEDCGHHDDHNAQKHGEHDNSSMVCLTQGKNVLSSHSNITIDSSYVAHDIHTTAFLFTEKELIDQYYYSIHDPGWGTEGVFSKFLDDLYGKGIVMID